MFVLFILCDQPSWWCYFGYFTGGFLDQKSPFFQEEFPSLVSGGEEKSPQQKMEEEKEPQYGPGPSLRPQSKIFTELYYQNF